MEANNMATNTEQKIIDNTIKMIDQAGYQNISLRKLAQQFNMTTGAFYKHFKNKEELFYRTSIVLSEQVANSLETTNGSAFEQLLAIAQGFCKLFQTNPNRMDFLFFNPTVINAYRQSNQDFPFLVMVRKLAHQFNPGEVSNDQFFNQIWSFIQGYALLIKNQVTSYDANLVEVTLLELTGASK
ncbi:TetR/AcrR family transcriptional regulator [Limosilactobacillus frumenti]|uniref:TetR/AcrR family transcriptional regulator n=1 Tax=Limosilactobacillus frumenti TaxID=104955 RepID=UPI001F3E7992|nr:TetR/AcrR family transcriptional regulator [Limosilactobacillus frumenti]